MVLHMGAGVRHVTSSLMQGREHGRLYPRPGRRDHFHPCNGVRGRWNGGGSRTGRIDPALPAAGLGRARCRRNLGQDPEMRARGHRPGCCADRRHRDHQSARNSCGLGPQFGRTACSRDCLAGPAYRGFLRYHESRWPRSDGPKANRPVTRSVLFRHQDAMDAGSRRCGAGCRTKWFARFRHDRELAGLQAIRRGTYQRCQQCQSIVAALARWGAVRWRSMRIVRGPACCLARSGGYTWEARRLRPAMAGRRRSHLRSCRRSAVGALRSSLLWNG